MNEPKPMSDQSMLWGHLLQFWEHWGVRAMLAGAALGLVALALSLFSSYVLYRVTGKQQTILESESKSSAERIATLTTEGDEARAEIARAKERTAGLERDAEQLKAANLALEAQIAPRRMSAVQQAGMVAAMTPFGGRKVRIRSYGLDVDAAVLGQQILTALQSANIIVDDRRMSDQSLGLIVTGVYVTGSDSAFVSAILSALLTAGIVTKIDEVPQGAGMQLADDGSAVAATVFVGAKPIAAVR